MIVSSLRNDEACKTLGLPGLDRHQLLTDSPVTLKQEERHEKKHESWSYT